MADCHFLTTRRDFQEWRQTVVRLVIFPGSNKRLMAKFHTDDCGVGLGGSPVFSITNFHIFIHAWCNRQMSVV